ncbi:hypothetical protein ACNQFZ_19855 [Schinkia sp. CFF1]
MGNILPEFFWTYDKIVVADVVENEISKWNKSDKFSFISTKFDDYKINSSILVIEHDVHIIEEDRPLIEKMMFDIGFSHGFQIAEPDKGEFVSAIYADYFGIPFMKTDDKAFKDGGRGKQEFPDLLVKDWYTVLNEIITDHGRRIKVNTLVEQERKRMDANNKKAKDEKKLDDMLALLASKYSKNSR